MMASATGNGMATPITPTKPKPSYGANESLTPSRMAALPGSPTTPKTFEADKPEGKSPTLLATDPVGTPDEDVELAKRRNQEEDDDKDSKDREVDIYADAVLACSIANPEACEMCSG